MLSYMHMEVQTPEKWEKSAVLLWNATFPKSKLSSKRGSDMKKLTSEEEKDNDGTT